MEPIRLRDRIVYEVVDSVATMTLDYPEKGNLQDQEMVWAFDDALTLAERDYGVKVVVIKANGKGFCAGHVGTGDYPEFNENRAHTGTTWTGQQTLFRSSAAISAAVDSSSSRGTTRFTRLKCSASAAVSFCRV